MSTQIATRPQSDLRELVQSDKIQQQLALALPRYYTPEKFGVIVRTTINRNPKIAECDPTSFLACLLTAAQMGLALDGRHAHLIPRWNSKANRMECTFQPDYKGLVSLIRRNDNVADLYAVVVKENDEFKIVQGLNRDIIHNPDVKSDRGEIIGAYAVIKYRDGSAAWEFMDRGEVESVRARSDSWKAHESKGYSTPWVADEGEMYKKTVIKRLSKLADLSDDTMERLNADTDIHFEKQAEITEVKRAVLPPSERDREGEKGETRALPEPKQEPEETAKEETQQTEVLPPEKELEPEPEAKPAEKKKTLLKKTKPAAQPEEEAPAALKDAPEESETLQAIRAKLEEGDYSEASLLNVCLAEKWITAGQILDDIDDKKLQTILTYWDEVKTELSSK